MTDRFVEEAKTLLLDKMECHPDPGVRAMTAFGLSDDTPQVQTIADVLRARHAQEQRGEGNG